MVQKSGSHQLRLVVCPIIYPSFPPHGLTPELDELRYRYFHNRPESGANLNNIQLQTNPTFNVKFMEENQATITILTNGVVQSNATCRPYPAGIFWLLKTTI